MITKKKYTAAPEHVNSRILVFNDSAVDVASVVNMLEGMGYLSVTPVTEPRHLLPTLSTSSFDAMLVDLRMPHLDDLKVDMHTDKGIVHLVIVGPGSVVGEASFYSHLPRIAAVSAYSDCKIWTLAPEDFERLSHANANVALAVSMALGTILATRMQDMSKRVAVV